MATTFGAVIVTVLKLAMWYVLGFLAGVVGLEWLGRRGER